MLIGFVQGYEELKWGISKPNPLCNGPLRIDNSRRGMMYSLWDISRTTKAIRSCDTSTERAELSAYPGVHLFRSSLI